MLSGKLFFINIRIEQATVECIESIVLLQKIDEKQLKIVMHNRF